MEHFEPNTALSHPYNDVKQSENEVKEEVKEQIVESHDNDNDNSEHYCVSESSKSSENGNDNIEDNDDVRVDDDEFASSPRILSPIQPADKEEELEEEKEPEEQYIEKNTFTENTHTELNEPLINEHHHNSEEEMMLSELELQTTPITRKSNDLVWDRSHLLQSFHSEKIVTPTNNSNSNNNKIVLPPCPRTPKSKFITQSLKTPLVNKNETCSVNTTGTSCHPYLITPATININNNNDQSSTGKEECISTQQQQHFNEKEVNSEQKQQEEENTTANNHKNTRMMNEQQNEMPHKQLIGTDCNNKTQNTVINQNSNFESTVHNIRHRQRAKSYSGLTRFISANNNYTNQNKSQFEENQHVCSSTPRPPRCPSSERSGLLPQRELFISHVNQPIHEFMNRSSNNSNSTPETEINLSHTSSQQESNLHYYNEPTKAVSNNSSITPTEVNTCTDNCNTEHVVNNNTNANNDNNKNKQTKEIISPSHVSLNSPMMQMAAVWVDAPVLPRSLSNNDLPFNNVSTVQSNTLQEPNMELGNSSYRQNKRRTTPRSRSTSRPPSPMTNTLVMPEHHYSQCESNIIDSKNNNNIERINVNTSNLSSIQAHPISPTQLDVHNNYSSQDNHSNTLSVPIRTSEVEKHLMSEIAQQQTIIMNELKVMNAGLQNLRCECVDEKSKEKENCVEKTKDNSPIQEADSSHVKDETNIANQMHEMHKQQESHSTSNSNNKDDKHRNNETLFEPPSYLSTLSSPSSSHPWREDKVEYNQTVSSSSSSTSSSVAVSPHVNKTQCKTELEKKSKATNEETMLHDQKDQVAVTKNDNYHDSKDSTSEITLDHLMQALERARQRALYIRDKTKK